MSPTYTATNLNTNEIISSDFGTKFTAREVSPTKIFQMGVGGRQIWKR